MIILPSLEIHKKHQCIEKFMKYVIPRINNFDLIRLLAALLVVYGHSLVHLKIDNSIVMFFHGFLQYFPGVPIFFTVSGFLIFWAFDRNKDIKKYAINRILRLYPALYVCLAITIGLLVFFATTSLLNNTYFYVWLAGQLSFFQFFTPEFLKFWGVGAPNGSLWTITVEVQFYILVPLIFLLMRKIKSWIVLAALFAISIIANFTLSSLPESTIQKISFVSIIPYLFNFLTGSIFYVFWEKLNKFIENKFMLWGLIYITYILIFGELLGFGLQSYQMFNIFHPITAILLSCLTLSFAFSFNNISEKVLKHNDISYGVYIYHMLVVNTLISLGYIGDVKYFILTFAITILLAYLSWRLIEKPSLNLKNRF